MMFIRPIPFVLFLGALLWLAAGRLAPGFIVYVALLWMTFGSVYTIALRRSPDLVKERFQPPSDRDRATRRVTAPLFLAHWIVAGLDARFGWTHEALRTWPIVLLGFVLMAAGLGFAGWTVLCNPFASSAVRIQSERNQTVITSGPYRFVRHPMYFGVVACCFGSPLALGSIVAGALLLPVLALFVRRTLIEDRMLHTELAGYADYATRVRSRVIPGLF